MQNKKYIDGLEETEKVFDAVIKEKDPQKRIESGWPELSEEESEADFKANG